MVIKLNKPFISMVEDLMLIYPSIKPNKIKKIRKKELDNKQRVLLNP